MDGELKAMSPTHPERVAQIDVALRRRFFPAVPQIDKPDRAGWTEDQHDINRLSRALAAYALVGHCNIDDATAVGCITDGSNDGGIDALYFDRAGNRLIFVQSQFVESRRCKKEDSTNSTRRLEITSTRLRKRSTRRE
jgi:hypothetical protein